MIRSKNKTIMMSSNNLLGSLIFTNDMTKRPTAVPTTSTVISKKLQKISLALSSCFPVLLVVRGKTTAVLQRMWNTCWRMPRCLNDGAVL